MGDGGREEEITEQRCSYSREAGVEAEMELGRRGRGRVVVGKARVGGGWPGRSVEVGWTKGVESKP